MAVAWTEAAPGPARGARRPPRRRPFVRVLLLLALPALLYAGSLRAEYHLDDIYRVRENQELERLLPLQRHFLDPRTSASLPTLVAYRPLLPLSLSLSLALSDALGIERRLGHGLANLALLLVLVLVAHGLFRELLAHWSRGAASARARDALATWSALALGLHPVAGIPVHYVCGRDLSMMLVLLLAALWTYARWRRLGGAWRVGLALVLLALSLLAKTNALVAPLLVLAFELGCGGLRPIARARVLACVILAALPGAAFVAFTRWVLGFSDAAQLLVERASPLEYPLTQLELHVGYYLRNAFWPYHMRVLPRLPAASGLLDPGVWLGALVVGGSLFLAWRQRRRAPLAASCVLGYWAAFALTSSVLPMRSFAADYRQLPSLVFLCLLAGIGLRAIRRPRARAALGIALLAWLGAGALLTGRDWRTEELLWGRSVRLGGTALAHMNYGVAVRARDPRLADEHFRRALELEPRHVLARVNLGLLALDGGRLEHGLALLDEALALQPGWALVHHWRAVGLARAGRLEEAVRGSERALELDPRASTYRDGLARHVYALALEHQRSGRVAASLRWLERLHEVAGPREDSLFLEGFALQQAGRLHEAAKRYDRHLAGRPAHAQARFNLAHAHMELGAYAQAVEGFRRVLALRPEYEEARRHRARCLEELGRGEGAAAGRARRGG